MTQERDVTTAPKESNDDNAPESEETPKAGTASPRRRQRKHPHAGMSFGRLREITKLIEQDRQNEVSAEEMDEYRRAQEDVSKAWQPLGDKMMRQLNPALPRLQDSLRKITEQNLRLSTLHASPSVKPLKIDPTALQYRPPVSQPDLDKISEGIVEAQVEKEAQVQRAQDTANRANDLLTELTALMASVETSNKNTEQIIREIKAHREDSEVKQDQQDKINTRLSWAAVLIGAGSVVVPIVIEIVKAQ